MANIKGKLKVKIAVLLPLFIIIFNPIIFSKLFVSDGELYNRALRLLLWVFVAGLSILYWFFIKDAKGFVGHLILNYKNYILLFLSIGLTLISVEFFLRNHSWLLLPRSYYVDGHEFKFTVSLNSHGFRDNEFIKQKSENAARIFLIGDSFVFGSAVDQKNTIGTLLEKKFKEGGVDCEVYNLGVHGAGPLEYLNIVKQFKNYRPDAIIISFYVDNDIVQRPKKANFYAAIQYGILNLKIIRLIENHLSKNRKYHIVEKYKIEDFYKRLCYEGKINPHILPRGTVGDNQKYYDSMLEIFKKDPTTKESILAIRQLYSDLPVLLLINPSKFQVSSSYFELMRKIGLVFDKDEVINRKIQDAIISWAVENKIDYLDILPIMMEDPNESFFYPIDTHYNLPGNRLVAEAIYDKLRKMNEDLFCS